MTAKKKTQSHRAGLKMTPEIRKGLDAYCRDNDRSISWTVREAVTAFLKKHGYL